MEDSLTETFMMTYHALHYMDVIHSIMFSMVFVRHVFIQEKLLSYIVVSPTKQFMLGD